MPRPKLRRAVVLALFAAALAAGCGATPGSVTPTPTRGLQGLILSPAKAAPALALRNYTGAHVSLSQFRGRAVFVTFVYTHCPDVCPLIVASLATAQRQLGSRARDVKILAVTVDPKRDTPAAITAFLATRDATGRMDYLLGALPQLQRVWKAWQVGVTLAPGGAAAGHSAVIYGITASGRMAVVYPSNVTPGQIVHDAVLLART
jgi:protein SCO1/2